MLLVLPTLVATTLAFAAEKTDYSAASFAAAQKAGKSILVEIQAPWCPTCRAQAPILSQLESAPKYVGLVVFHVDFDSQKDAVRGFGARMQSTLIAFKGQTETAGRSATPSRTPSRRCWRLHSERGPGIVGAGRLRSRVGGGLERAAAAPTLAEERDFQMRSRRSFAFWTLGLSVLLIASQAVGAEHREYAADAFDSAQRTGKSIIVVVRASWCPSCRVQESILSIIEYNPKYAGLVVFLVDFDAQKDALWQLDARAPSNSYCLQGRRRDRPIRRRNPSRFDRRAAGDDASEDAMTLAPIGLAFVAGFLSILSPCVLPLVPIVFGTAASEHRFGPVALAAGVTLSFVTIGLFVATIGLSLGIDGDTIPTAQRSRAGRRRAGPGDAEPSGPGCARGRTGKQLGGFADPTPRGARAHGPVRRRPAARRRLEFLAPGRPSAPPRSLRRKAARPAPPP